MKTLLTSLISLFIAPFLLLTACTSSEGGGQVIVSSNGEVIDTVHPGQSKDFYLGQGGSVNEAKDAETIESEKQRVQSVYEKLLKCPSCSVTLQHITYLDNSDHQKKEVDAYAIMQNGTLFYMTADEMKVIQKRTNSNLYRRRLTALSGKETS